MYKKNKQGFSLVDAGLAVMILTVLSFIFFGVTSAYYRSIVRAEESNYLNFSLSECAEVIHSFRYGAIDNNGSAGWSNYQNSYPTSMYRLNYNSTTKAWEAQALWKEETNKVPYKNLMELLNEGYTPENEGEKYTMGEKKGLLTRYVHINNDNVDKSVVTCYAKYDNYMFKKEFLTDADEYNVYSRLRFIMTDY